MARKSDKANSIKIRGEYTPITVKRPYVSMSIGTALKPSQLPRTNKKYRPDAGSTRFAKASTCASVTRLLDDTVDGPNVRDVTELRRTNNGLERVKTEKYWTPKKPLPKGL